MRTVGIIGNLGPATTAEIYLRVNNAFRESEEVYPGVIIDGVSFPYRLEQEIIIEERNEEGMLQYVISSAKRLEGSGADFIVLPCNTLHVFIDELREAVSVPVVSIVEETAIVLSARRVSRVGLLATTKTITEHLYQKVLKEFSIESVLPDGAQQANVSKAIYQFLSYGEPTGKRSVVDTAKMLHQKGAQAIVLGCTDLQNFTTVSELTIPVIDTVTVLTDKIITELKRG